MPEQSQSGNATVSEQSDRDYRKSEEFRAACEARYVLAKPLAERRKYLEGVGTVRGTAAKQYLERVILAEWKKKAPAKGG